jgi:uncharacterized phiE125 gp8 family phage protein
MHIKKIEETTAPVSEPVTLIEMKLWAKVDITEDDALITALITAARIEVENDINRALINTTSTMYMNAFFTDKGDAIQIETGNVTAINSIKYLDDAGSLQTWSTSEYETDFRGQFSWFKPVDGDTYPTTDINTFNAVEVEFVAGYGATASSVPENIKVAIKMLVTDMYEHREAQVEISLKENKTIQRLLRQVTLRNFF